MEDTVNSSEYKIKAKCPSCRTRLFRDPKSHVPACRNGHEVGPLVSPRKGTVSTAPKQRRDPAKATTSKGK